jgi:hypothetical protein
LQYPKTHFSNIPAFQHSNWGEAPNLFTWGENYFTGTALGTSSGGFNRVNLQLMDLTDCGFI